MARKPTAKLPHLDSKGGRVLSILHCIFVHFHHPQSSRYGLYYLTYNSRSTNLLFFTISILDMPVPGVELTWQVHWRVFRHLYPRSIIQVIVSYRRDCNPSPIFFRFFTLFTQTITISIKNLSFFNFLNTIYVNALIWN